MRIAFTKMHGAGNDFLVMDVPADGALPDSEQWRRLADRRSGVGFDQALVLGPAQVNGSAAHYRIFNADGGEVEQCGNGARCIAHYLRLRGRGGAGGTLSIDGTGGVVMARPLDDGRYAVDLGVPNFEPASLPFRDECASRLLQRGRDAENYHPQRWSSRCSDRGGRRRRNRFSHSRHATNRE